MSSSGTDVVTLHDEEPSNAPVVALRERSDLAGADDANEPGRLEHLEVVADSALRRLERDGELAGARGSLAQQHHDARPEGVTEGAELLRILDDEDVVELVVG